jgi:kinetochore protein Spc7/SPC105
MTTAVGGILQPQRSTGTRDEAKKIMELEADNAASPFHIEAASPAKASSHTIASETGSPSLAAFKGKALRRSTETRKSTTPTSKLSTAIVNDENTITPPKQATPQLPQSAIPSKTPPSKNVIMRMASPKKLFKDELKTTSTPPSRKKSTTSTPNKLFHQNKTTGVATPSVVLTPKQRRSSGLGLDKAGLGSPRVAAILDRRRSIGEQAKSFTPGQSPELRTGVRFQDPRAMENEIDDERTQEMAREDGKAILEREVDMTGDDKDATLNLKEMIHSLTPKKNPLRGRKSLHVGAATGILGKRPAELDEDEEDEDEGGVKRLKGHQGSPVKNVRLQGPPSKAETIGRATRSARKSLDLSRTISTPTTTSPATNQITTPRSQARFKDAEYGGPILPPSEKTPVDEPQTEDFGEDERIQLQDFLNMTSIRFMELTTTKRRHTVAPRSSAKDFVNECPASLEDCVAAGAATIPMLELFQHVSLSPYKAQHWLTLILGML